MALLPSTRLVVCPSCAEHIKAAELRCPHCGAERPRVDGVSAAATAVLMSLTLAGCTGAAPRPGDADPTRASKSAPAKQDAPVSAPEPAYGVPMPPRPDPRSDPPGPEPEYGVVMAPAPDLEPEPAEDRTKKPARPKSR